MFNMMGGFEGGKNKNKDSIYFGKRWDGGWKQEGLPWTYSMDSRYLYRPDVGTSKAVSGPAIKGVLLSRQ